MLYVYVCVLYVKPKVQAESLLHSSFRNGILLLFQRSYVDRGVQEQYFGVDAFGAAVVDFRYRWRRYRSRYHCTEFRNCRWPFKPSAKAI